MKSRHDTGTTAETPEQLIEHISRLMAEAEAMITGPVAEQADTKLSEVKARLHEARERLGEMYGRARRGVAAGAKYADETIHEHPYYSIGLALGVGLLVGALLRRRD